MKTATRSNTDTQPARTDDGQEMIGRLNSSFQTFITLTEDLKEAYERLREKADAMDLELKETNTRLNDLLQSMPSAVVAVDAERTVTQFNRAAEKMMGLAADQVVGRRLASLPALEKAVLLGCCEHSSPEEGCEEDRRMVTPRGLERVVNSRVAPLLDGWIEILTDLTETDRLRREVHRLDTLAAMGEMAAAVAHQVRNPLNGVEGFASLLLRNLERGEGSEADRCRHARNVVAGVREVNEIITGMLMLVRSERLQLQPQDLNRLVRDAVRTAGSQAAENPAAAGIEFRPAPAGAWVSGDAFKLKQILLNLIHNGLEALPGQGRGGLRITVRRPGSQAEIRVADSGTGMSPEQAAKVFRPFFTTKEGGIGLGLSVAAKIVDLHGGALSVRSVPDRGTVFKIVLPGIQQPARNGECNDRACARCG